MAINRPRGTNDLLPEDTAQWQAVEALLRACVEQRRMKIAGECHPCYQGVA